MPSETYIYFVKNVYPKISSVSAFLALIVVLTMIVLSIYDFKLVNRITLRLQTAISALDIWTHTTAFWFKYYSYPGPMCTFIAWQRFFGPLLFLFLNISIAVNLHMVFLHEIHISKWIEAIYWIAPIILASLITIPLLALGYFGYAEQDGCFITEERHSEYSKIDFFGFRLWTILTLIYCTSVVILVVFKLRRNIEKIKISRRFTSIKDTSVAIKKATQLVYRILLYPLVAILATSGVLVSQLYIHITNKPHEGLDTWSLTSLALSGTFNFIAFLCDPTLHTAISTIYLRFMNRSIRQPDGVFEGGSSLSTYQSNPTAVRLNSNEGFNVTDTEAGQNNNKEFNFGYTHEITRL